ncbi:general transcription factor 3C polypeptide 6 [Lycorma delicatula]|uniref:general transcription factor 3C polypeptide 6 n=1 Tax=Lycorma delicatula TaxID=130591 RepID=UPI003F51212D
MSVTAETLTSSMQEGRNEDEYEEEDILVHVEFDCEVDPSMFNAELPFKIIGIDSQNPLMQVGNKVFQGQWRDVIGTSVFFEEDEEKKLQKVDALFSKQTSNPMKLACCTRKSLIMSRVFVKPKSNPQSGNLESQSEEQTPTQEVPVKNEADINEDKNVEKMDVT